MKKILFLAFSLFVGVNLFSQKIASVQAYARINGTRVLVLTEDNQTAFYTVDDGWNALPVNEIPEGQIKFLDVYHTATSSKLLVVLEDNSMWQNLNEEWSLIENKGLPKNYSIKIFRPFTKAKMYGVTEMQIVMMLEDNTMWFFSKKDGWESLPKSGIPAGVQVTNMVSYQEIKGMMNVTNTFAVVLSNHTMMSYDLKKKKWNVLQTAELPKNASVTSMDAYLKSSVMGSPESRIIVSLSDHSIWWCLEKNQKWKKLDKSGLPANVGIKSIKVFTKLTDSRVLVLLDDDTLWWYVDKQGFSKVDMTGFSESLSK